SLAPCLAAARERYRDKRRPQTFTCHQPARSTTSILIFLTAELLSVRRRRRLARSAARSMSLLRALNRRIVGRVRPGCSWAERTRSTLAKSLWHHHVRVL